MPRYNYECQNCFITSSVFHLMSEVREDCNACNTTGSLVKIIGMPTFVKKKTSDTNKVGSLTQEYIKLNKEILEDEKIKAREENYEPS
tara:strand:+ start:242 stop:505 length:264 start_codon:yes stop_codon:yes gene_type:complete